MKCKIKICGLKSIEDVSIINRFPVSYGGFIFAEKSPRNVTVSQAKGLLAHLREDIKSVGVFTDTPIEEINGIADEIGLDIIQLHSSQTNEDCKKVKRPVWKMIPVKNEDSLEQIKHFEYAQGILLDTYHKNLLGGSGKQFCWDLAKGLSNRCFLILAGGLNPDNIVQAASMVQPHVLDVNSGVETNGIKNEEKLKLLFHNMTMKNTHK